MRLSLAPVTAAALLIAVTVYAQPAAPGVAPTPLVDPSGDALRRFHAALAEAEAGRGRARITVWGASHTASDQFPGVLRASLQARYGDAGAGWVPLVEPHRYYAHRQVRVAGAGFEVQRVRRARPRGRDFGASGWAFVAGPRARARLQLTHGTPSDQALILGDSDGLRARVGGRAAAVRSGRVSGPLLDLELRPREGARLTGVSLERSAAGVLVDSIGVPGSRFRDRTAWDPAHVRRVVRALAPDLVIFAYGTNEAGIARRSARVYRAEVTAALDVTLRARPEASCLLLGPSDWPLSRDGAFVARPRIAEIISVQRAAAAAHGCAFVDLQALTGGPLSMLDWERGGLAVGDHVHFTDAGHARIARALRRLIAPRTSPP